MSKFATGSRIEVDLYSPRTGKLEITRTAIITGRYEIGASEELLHATSLVDRMEPDENKPRRGYLVRFDGYDTTAAFEDARDFRPMS